MLFPSSKDFELSEDAKKALAATFVSAKQAAENILAFSRSLPSVYDFLK